MITAYPTSLTWREKISPNLKNHSNEDGLTVVEVMVAAIIIVIVLLFTANALAGAFKASSFTENRAKAASYANNVIAVAKQADFRAIWMPGQAPDAATIAKLYGGGKCHNPNGTSFETIKGKSVSNLPAVTTGKGTAPYKGLNYCVERQATSKTGPVGTSFYVQTDVRWVETTGLPDQKRIIVTVRWQDVYAGEGKWHTYRTSFTRTPSIAECVPTTITVSGTKPAGCER